MLYCTDLPANESYSKGTYVSNLIQLKNQVKSIQATLKMTQAIRLVSMSVYSKLDRQQIALKNYFERHKKLLHSLLNTSLEIKHPLLTPPEQGKKLFVIIATNKGLCGSLNTNLFSHIQASKKLNIDKQAAFITIGQKAKKFVKDNNYKEIICSYQELNGENYRSLTNDLIDRIFSSKDGYSSVTFFSNQLHGFFKQVPHTTPLIPLHENVDLEAKSAASEPEIDLTSWTWEQPQDEIFEYLFTSYLKAHVSTLLYNALLAEHAARFFAMDNSTTNANKLLEHLSLLYNKQRQTVITKEVAELSSFSPQHESGY